MPGVSASLKIKLYTYIQCDACFKWRQASDSLRCHAANNDFFCAIVDKKCGSACGYCEKVDCSCTDYTSILDSIYVLTRLLRHRESRDNSAIELAQLAYNNPISRDSKVNRYCHTGVYAGYLNKEEAVRNCENYAISILPTDKPSISKLLLLTHMSQYALWWGHPDQLGTCKKITTQIKFFSGKLGLESKFIAAAHRETYSSGDVKILDIYAQCAISTDEFPDRIFNAVLRIISKLSPNFQPPKSEQKKHLLMLAYHIRYRMGIYSPRFIRPKKCNSMRNLLFSKLNVPNSSRIQDIPFEDFDCCFELYEFARYCARSVGIIDFEFLESLSYVRIKKQVGSYTELHSDFSNVVEERGVVSLQEAGRIYTVWVALDNISPEESVLFFPPKAPLNVKIGTVYVFDLCTWHQATVRKSGASNSVRMSVDFRIKV